MCEERRGLGRKRQEEEKGGRGEGVGKEERVWEERSPPCPCQVPKQLCTYRKSFPLPEVSVESDVKVKLKGK